jgi:hypothetical protein
LARSRENLAGPRLPREAKQMLPQQCGWGRTSYIVAKQRGTQEDGVGISLKNRQRMGGTENRWELQEFRDNALKYQ